jgi:hypothetical protein
VKENNEYLGNISFVEMDIPKLINYSTDMCWNGQGTTVLFMFHSILFNEQILVLEMGFSIIHIMFFSLEHSWKWSLINRSLLVQKVLHNTYGHFRSMGILGVFPHVITLSGHSLHHPCFIHSKIQSRYLIKQTKFLNEKNGPKQLEVELNMYLNGYSIHTKSRLWKKKKNCKISSFVLHFEWFKMLWECYLKL